MFELRWFRDSDADAVWALHQEALEDAGVDGGRGRWEEDLRDISASYTGSGGDFLVCLLDGELVGMGGLGPRSGGVFELRRMRVRSDRQRRGLGRRILEGLEERAGELGFGRVVLDTTEGQIAARRLAL